MTATRARVSVAMATWNGLPHLPEQLQSILSQSVVPDEIVVCDDASTDGTWDCLQRASAADPRVRVFRNARRLGSTQNFDRALGLCTGDIIFLSDQDDIWAPTKVEELAHELHARGVVLAMSNGEVVDAGGRPLGLSLWRANGIDAQRAAQLQSDRACDALAQRVYLTGSALCFSASLKSAVQPMPERVWHDQWIAFVAALTHPDAIALLDRPLYRYRQHAGNQIGARQSLIRRALAEIRSDDYASRDLAFCCGALERIETLAARVDLGTRGARVRETLQRRVAHTTRRRDYVEGRAGWLEPVRPGRIADYCRYSRGARTIVGDLFRRLYQRRAGRASPVQGSP